jgi:hypothetical protein
MKAKDNKKKVPDRKAGNEEKKDLPGYPLYPEGEDLYSKYHKEKNIDPEDLSGIKESNKNDKTGKNNEKDFIEDASGSDLDVPGSELDDNQENIGSEDEENNYYSIGGDDHEDLDEDKGE